MLTIVIITFFYLGAENITTDTTVVSGISSVNKIECNGSENNTTSCNYVMNPDSNMKCSSETLIVKCFISDITTTQGMGSPDTSVHQTVPISQHPKSTATNSDGQTSTTPSGSGSQNSLLKPPTLYYVIIGVVAVVLALILLAVVTVILCCGRSRLRWISPHITESQNGFTKEKDGTLRVELTDDSPKIKDGLVHHQLQSGPVYEAIGSSSPKSQESPNSRSGPAASNVPPLPPPHHHTPSHHLTPQGPEFYSVLEKKGTYIELQPHVSSTLPRAEPQTCDSDYHQLDHKTSSLQRSKLPSDLKTSSLQRTWLPSDTKTSSLQRAGLPSVQAAKNLEQGMVGELGGQGNIRSTSFNLPRDTSLSGHRLQLTPNRKPLDYEVQQNCNDGCGSRGSNDHNSGQNIYHTIEPPPDYACLEEVEEPEVCTKNGLCNGNARNIHDYGVDLSGPQNKLECPDNSGQCRTPALIVPSSHTSPLSSPTRSTTSNSPQINREKINFRVQMKNKRIQSPEISRKGMDGGSPMFSKMNRHVDQFDNNDAASTKSDETLV